MTVKIAVAGTGYFSQFHYDAWLRLAEAELVGVASLDPKGLADVGDRYGVSALFDDVRIMLDQTEPDLLDIVTPPAVHRDLLEEAAKRGVDVICQKPLGGDLETARSMSEMAKTAGIRLIVHENFRFQPWHRESKRVIESGRLGEITNISFRLRPGDGQGPDAYLDRQPYFQTMERFLVHETAIHQIDCFRYLMGNISAVFARLRRLNPAIRGEDAGYLLFEFASGASGLFDGNRLIDFPAENPRLTMGTMMIEGSGGVLRLDGDGRLWLRPYQGEEQAHPCKWKNRGFGGDCVFALQQHVLDHLTKGAALENRAEDYLKNLEIEEAIYRSAETGRLEHLG
ncbi:MAG: Gfo/Idh/MocA family protein [Geminicoccaceae bacterium]